MSWSRVGLSTISSQCQPTNSNEAGRYGGKQRKGALQSPHTLLSPQSTREPWLTEEQRRKTPLRVALVELCVLQEQAQGMENNPASQMRRRITLHARVDSQGPNVG